MARKEVKAWLNILFSDKADQIVILVKDGKIRSKSCGKQGRLKPTVRSIAFRVRR
jgi:hypothetical protein